MRQSELDLLALSLIPGLGNVRLRELLNHHETATNILQLSRRELQKIGLPPEVQVYIASGCATRDAEKTAARALAKGIHVCTWIDKKYPACLRQIYDPPQVLYLKGDPDHLKGPAVAVVGARRCSTYGRAVAFKLAGELASLGLTIVSGLARGIDSRAHQGALEGGGSTVAVLGSGVDVIYPRENRELYDQICCRGCVLSEFPMGAYPAPQNFPIRNRVISGLACGTLIPEAAEFSGSLITARLTLEQNRELWAVPGNITNPGSYGPNYLIKQGASPVMTVQDVLDELPLYILQSLRVTEDDDPEPAKLNGKEKMVLDRLEMDTAIHFDLILEATELDMPNLNAALFSLELKGLIEQHPGRRYSRKLS